MAGARKWPLFQSTLPVGGATYLQIVADNGKDISIHAPRGGSDLIDADSQCNLTISIHAPRGGSDARRYRCTRWGSISIHAPRGGSDLVYGLRLSNHRHFNPRSPWGERLLTVHTMAVFEEFQSTLPVGGATLCRIRSQVWSRRISIHAPRGGSDPESEGRSSGPSSFQSTLPVGGATVERCQSFQRVDISIHAPRGGSDPANNKIFCGLCRFQSTLPVGGATSEIELAIAGL